ncbi:putative uncharacterized protein DDB_G0282133 isoform X3 [Teleopsis dalmanni]|uniref:putative uncharacterized protein DDB_G0282133 isoform X3 n=1 Tax=Teleopsis dalmanni TaxID=139649 RepID=UPI0018CF8343|nr:putative uncharacterized protein DDB_G0282133 isoform X3 [Teleopsis dalmanni]
MDYFTTLDYTSLGLVAAPIVAITFIGYILWNWTEKNDTMQHKSSTAGHVNSKSSNRDALQAQQLNGSSKNESYDSSFAGNNGHNHQNHQQQQQQHSSNHHGHHQQNGNRQRKSRNNNHQQKRQDNNGGGQKQRNPTDLTVENWLGNNLDYCYERRRYNSSSLYAEDNATPRHNPKHRNSDASETTGSDDVHITFSSNEDLVGNFQSNSKSNKKTKSRQKRQQKNKQSNKNRNNNNNGSVAQANYKKEIPMDIEEETKENRRPNYDSNIAPKQSQQQQQQQHHLNKNIVSAQSLRKQCTKTAALKSANKNKNNNNNDNVTVNKLTTSPSNTSVCSVMSTRSLPSSVSSSASNSPTASPTVSKRNAQNYKKIVLAFQPSQIDHMDPAITEQQLVDEFQRYVVDSNLMRVYGYPIESAIHRGCTEIYKILPKPIDKKKDGEKNGYPYEAGSNVINSYDGLYISYLDSEKHYQEYIDAHNSSDSGQGSGESSPFSMDSDSSEICEEDSNTATTYYTPDGTYQIFSQYDQSLKKQCIRCKSEFHVTESGEYLNCEECVYHWGKIDNIYVGGEGISHIYTCCRRDYTDKGCSRNRLHVWSGAVIGINGPYTDYVYTRPNYDPNSKTKIYAIDCEMSFTGRGLELTKVSVVGYDGQLVYEHFVRPKAEIVDYNTRFSGITEENLAYSNKSVKTLPEVQRDLLKLFDANTLLIGHGLDNDLRALRMVHKNIVDTSVAFPHPSGFPFRRSLKFLTKSWLGRDIQGGKTGHDSFEDSLASLELMRWRIFNEQEYARVTQAMFNRHFAMSHRC